MTRSKISMVVTLAAALVAGCSGGNSKGKDGPESTSARIEVAPVNLPSPAGAAFTTAVGVNESNTVVGWSGGTFGAKGVTWSVAGQQVPAAPVEHLPIEGNFESAAYGASGSAVVGESRKGTESVAVAWLGGSATPTELSLAGFSQPAVAFGIAGSRIVGQATIPDPDPADPTDSARTVAVIWSSPQAAPAELGTLDSNGHSRAYAITDAGLVIGEATVGGAAGGPTRGVVWQVDMSDGDVVDGPDPLSPLATDVSSVALGVSGGSIVGESQAADQSVRAVQWTISGGGNISQPVEIGPGSASAVSGPLILGQSARQATLWDLGNLTTPLLVSATVPSQALGINAIGTIVGFRGTSAFVSAGEGAGPATGVTMTANLASPQPTGTAVVFTAQGIGSTSPYQYRFWLYRNGAWEVVQDYGIGSTYTLPSTTAAGIYDLSVHVRTSSDVEYDAVLDPAVTYRILASDAGPATGVTLTPNVASPQVVGTPVTFTAQGQGSTGTYQYRFWLYRNGAWEVVQDYGVGSTYTLPGTTPAGTYDVSVHVRTSDEVEYDAVLNPSLTYRISSIASGPATGVTLVPSLASPQPAGAAVTFTAQGEGSTSTYQYRFWLYRNGAWEIARDWAETNTWALPEALAAGVYDVSVHVRTDPTGPAEAMLNPSSTYVLF